MNRVFWLVPQSSTRFLFYGLTYDTYLYIHASEIKVSSPFVGTSVTE